MVDGWFSRFAPTAFLWGEIAPDVSAIERGFERNEADRRPLHGRGPRREFSIERFG